MEYDGLDPDSHLGRLLSTFRPIDRLAKRRQVFGQQNCCYCVEFLSALATIEGTSCGAHQWAAHLVTGIFVGYRDRPRRFLIVAYSNPNKDGTPNHLSFLVPIYLAEGTLFVCFARACMTTLTVGLYWRGDELVLDYFEDKDRLWGPLKASLWPSGMRPIDELPKDSSREQLDAGTVTLEGISYKESVRALTSYLAQSKELLADEILR